MACGVEKIGFKNYRMKRWSKHFEQGTRQGGQRLWYDKRELFDAVGVDHTARCGEHEL